MERFKIDELTVEAGTTFLTEGQGSPLFFTALQGYGVRHKTLPNGRRQIVRLVFPGDLLGLEAGLTGRMGHSVEARTRMILCVFDSARLDVVFREQPDRARDLAWLATAEAQLLGDLLVTVGQRDASQRIAWAFVSIRRRLAAIGLERDGAVPLPFRQQDLADTLGLSLVHTNKTLARLRQAGLCDWTEGELRIHDLPALAALALVPLDGAEPRPLM